MTDLLIKGATVLDGTGAPGYPADVLVDRGRIASIRSTESPGAEAERTIDAEGLVLCPGFIDMHAHSDLQILANTEHTAKVSQGVTLEVLGQDGLSFAPIDDSTRAAVRRQIAGWNGEPDDFDFSWDSVAGYLDRLDQGIACNAAYLVPQGTLRMMVVGTANRPATPSELAEMKRLLAEGLEQGAAGMSSGLTYTPGMFADTAELVELCRVVAEYGGYYSPHQRSYGKGALEAYGEMVEVARQSGCALHLTHAVMNFEPNQGRGVDLLAMLDQALADGIDITTDTYPYLPGATTLAAILPSWTAEGGPDALLARLADPVDRERITYELEQVGTDGCHGCVTDWNTIEIGGVKNETLSGAVGNTIAAIAAGIEKPPAEVFFDLLIRDNLATTILQHVGHEENVQAIMKHRTHTGGSDAILVGGKPHPRAWGTFPRYLAHYVRELGVLELADCVHHLTGRPARRLRLADRGLVREGYHADLVLFDPDGVRDTATFDNPRQQAEGIPWVLVAGVPVIADGRRTDALPGHAIRRTDAHPAGADRSTGPAAAANRRDRAGRHGADRRNRAGRRGADRRTERGNRMTTLELLRSDRVLSVVRAPAIDDAKDLCAALVAGGIHVIELTFTTPDLPRHLERAASTAAETGAVVGAGTVQTAAQAKQAVDAGAQFLVTPGQGLEAAEIVAAAHDAGIPVVLGAFTPSEVMTATALGSDAVKIFPAHQLGPKYLKDLSGPFPGVPLVPSGGVNAGNARQFLDAGALAVSAGTDVVSPADVEAGRWADITAKATTFCTALR